VRIDRRPSSPPTEEWSQITDEAARLCRIGALVLQEFTGHHIVMADPEGNEFCIA
jgi:hypothetical protein